MTEQKATPHAVDSVATDPPPRDSGRVSFRWVRGGLIGEGTRGKVYIALNATTGEMMAVKQVDKSHGPGDESNPHQLTTLEALKNEIAVLKGLSHPNIVEYLGLEEVSHFLNAYVDSPLAFDDICLQIYGCFNEDTIKSFTKDILHGVEYLHSEGIALRADHTPVAGRSCKISGFGRSKCVVDANTLASGPIYWLAPEEINSSKNEYQSKIDIWGVGCIVVEMWTGARPWNGQDLAAILFHVMIYSAACLSREQISRCFFKTQLHTKKSPPVPLRLRCPLPPKILDRNVSYRAYPVSLLLAAVTRL
ncbi:Serine/threonine-protein kinase BCK1/SLK1/SSP31 [Grifola frondosa]|uniref:Serine/threonine-protein kinase BCK1/SLK1/SSP31 n=1 Tax=Grifola frondosa TaxID=5627 RepID=A0A1C7LT04_GRIFR|nr:Serine/threonine-protein kinase BCK1/SLK1/SSP31 [Grifola frondosa]